MNVPPTTSGPPSPDAASSTDRQTLGKDVFLQLLITQLQHQDPTSPQDEGEFVAQLAQFSTLEKLTEISSGIDQLRALVAAGSGLPAGATDVEGDA